MHNIDSDNDNSTVISIQTKFILKKDKKKKQSSGKLKKVSFSCEKEKEKKVENTKEKSKEKIKPKFTSRDHGQSVEKDAEEGNQRGEEAGFDFNSLVPVLGFETLMELGFFHSLVETWSLSADRIHSFFRE